MSLVAFGSVKGAPGVTTTLAALGLVWPAGRPLLLAEADPSGGDLGPRHDLAPSPGLVTLAATGRHDLTGTTLDASVQPLPGSPAARVLVGPVSADQATAALASLRGRLVEVLTAIEGTDVLVDCGRLDPGSPALEVFARADLAVLMARPAASDVHHLASRLAALDLDNPVALLCLGERPYGPGEVSATLGVPTLGALPDDRKAAGVLNGTEAAGARLLARSALLRSARSLASTLISTLHGAAAPPVPAPTNAAPQTAASQTAVPQTAATW